MIIKKVVSGYVPVPNCVIKAETIAIDACARIQAALNYPKKRKLVGYLLVTYHIQIELSDPIKSKNTNACSDFILEYLKGKDYWTSPTLIGNAYGNTHGMSERGSSWASPKCIKLVKKGLLIRNGYGHYKLRG